jgi:hypothetical protein
MPPDLAKQLNPSPCQADFTYAITPKTIEIQDTGKGKKSLVDDLEAVVSAPRLDRSLRISYTSTLGTEHLVEWDGKRAREQRQLE